MKPWEKYAAQVPQSEGQKPWEKYAEQPSQPSQPEEDSINDLNRKQQEALVAGNSDEAKAIGNAIKNKTYDQSSFIDKAKKQATNLATGMLSGAATLGRTALLPLSATGLLEKIDMQPATKEQMNQYARQEGADTDSIGYGAGKLGSEIAGTAGTGALLGGALQAAKLGAIAPGLVQAIKTSGFAGKGVPLLQKMIGGGITGAAATGLLDPSLSSVATGGAIGAALPGVGPALGAIARGTGSLASSALGKTTGAGQEAIKAAVEAGKAGGSAAESFKAGLRGNSNADDAVELVKAGIKNIKDQRNAAYRSGMFDISKDATVLDINPIKDAALNASKMGAFKDAIKDPATVKKVKEAQTLIRDWGRKGDDYLTPEGMDALKQAIGSITESIPYEQKTARNALTQIYNSAKNSISEQAPTYNKLMSDYGADTKSIKEFERVFSAGDRSASDSAARKLIMSMRDNQNSKNQLLGQLEERGGTQIKPLLAGEALSQKIPNGLGGALNSLSNIGAFSVGGLPGVAANSLLSSPRVIGESAFLLGKLTGRPTASMRSIIEKMPAKDRALLFQRLNLPVTLSGGDRSGTNNY
jgi:hypothetical protein